MIVEQLYLEILQKIGHEELQLARNLVGSRTLRNALQLIIEESLGRAVVFIPHYWAVYYHDGRGSIHPTTATKLVFFDSPEDDPRLEGGFPERASELRRLTREEFYEGLAINEERRENGERPFMFVVDSVGPAAPHPFFDRMARDASSRLGADIARIFDQHIQFDIDNDPVLKSEKKTAKIL